MQLLFYISTCWLQQVGDDKTIKQWKMEAPGYGEEEEPLNTILGKVWSVGIFCSITKDSCGDYVKSACTL